MKIFQPVSRRAYIVGSTLTIILLVFGYYLLVYLPQQEEELITHRARALNRITNNFIEKYAVSKKVKTNSKDPTYDILIDGEFLHNILTPGIFDEYQLYKNQRLIYQSSSGAVFVPQAMDAKDNKVAKIAFETLTAGQLFPVVTDAKLGFINYKLFSTSFKTESLPAGASESSPSSGNSVADSTQTTSPKTVTWTLYALVNAEKFEAEKRSVSPFLVVNLSVVLLLIVFSAPFLKQVFMSSIEQINRNDVIFITTSFLLSTAVVILSLLTLNSYFVDTKNTVDGQLKSLSDTITQHFETEIFQMNRLINTFDKPGAVLSEQLGSADSCKRQNGITNNINVFEQSDTKSKTSDYPYFKNIYWMDQKGVSRLWYLGKGREKCPSIDHIYLGSRSYFKNIVANRGWHAAGIDTLYMVESIYSWLTTENLGVFSKPSQAMIQPYDSTEIKAQVVGVSSVMYSVIDPILPPGFGFCIIDQAGNVQFHSNKDKNLRENFLIECNKPSALQAALQSNITAYADARYHNLSHRLYIQPFTVAPWYLITFQEQSISTSPYAQIILYAFMGIMILGFTGGLQSLLVYAFCTQSSKLKRAYFPFEWLRPSTGKNEKYVLIIVLILLYFIINCIYNVYHCHSLILTLTSFQFTMMLAYVFAFAVLMPEEENLPHNLSHRYWLVIIAILSLSLLTLLLSIDLSSNGSGTLSAEQKAHIFLWFGLLVLAGILFLLQHFAFHKGRGAFPVLESLFTKTRDWHYQPYVWMLYSYLLMNGVLSTLLIFQKSYEQEMPIWKRNDLYQLATRLEIRDQEIEQQYNKNNPQDQWIASKRKELGLYFSAVGFDTPDSMQVAKAFEKKSDSSNSHFENLLFQTRLYFSSLMEDVSGFTYRKGNEGEKWKTGQSDSLSLLFLTLTRSDLRQQAVALSVPIPRYYLWSPHLTWGNIFFALTIIIFLIGVYKSLQFVVNRIYALNLFNREIPIQENSYLKQCIDEGNRDLMIISLPFSGIDALFSNPKHPTQVISLTGIGEEEGFKKICEKAKDPTAKIVILTQFGYQFQNIAVSNKKLQLLESLLSLPKTIFIVSDVLLSQIFEVYEEMIQNSNEYEKKLVYENLISRWRELLSGFITSHYFTAKDRPREKLKEECTLEELIDYEQEAFPVYFTRFCPSLKEKYGDPENRDRGIKEDIVLKLQNLAQPFYLSLWNTCSKEERYLLYDLSTDNFTNPKNEESINILVKKGLIFYDESLYVMNESFRNFILTTAKESEALELEKEMNKTGTWRLIQVVIAILALSLIVFVTFAQESLLNNFLAILTSLAAIAPFLLKLSGLFSSSLTSSKNE